MDGLAAVCHWNLGGKGPPWQDEASRSAPSRTTACALRNRCFKRAEWRFAGISGQKPALCIECDRAQSADERRRIDATNAATARVLVPFQPEIVWLRQRSPGHSHTGRKTCSADLASSTARADAFFVRRSNGVASMRRMQARSSRARRSGAAAIPRNPRTLVPFPPEIVWLSERFPGHSPDEKRAAPTSRHPPHVRTRFSSA